MKGRMEDAAEDNKCRSKEQEREQVEGVVQYEPTPLKLLEEVLPQ